MTLTVTPTPTAYLSLMKVVTPSGVILLPATTQTPVTFTISYSNTGGEVLTNVMIWDTLNTGLCYLTTTAGAALTADSVISCTSGSFLVWNAPSPLVPGSSGNIVFSALINNVPYYTNITNFALAGADQLASPVTSTTTSSIIIYTLPQAGSAPPTFVLNNLSLQLSWTPGIAGSYPIAGYPVWRSADGGFSYSQITLTGSSITSCTDQLPAVQTFIYLVKVMDTLGNEVAYPPLVLKPLPVSMALDHNSFNPAKGGTLNVKYHLRQLGSVSIYIYNLRGNLVRKLVDDTETFGEHVAQWDGKNGQGDTVSSGVYLFHLEAAGGDAVNQRVAVIK